jgi:hypothetical protein
LIDLARNHTRPAWRPLGAGHDSGRRRRHVHRDIDLLNFVGGAASFCSSSLSGTAESNSTFQRPLARGSQPQCSTGEPGVSGKNDA